MGKTINDVISTALACVAVAYLSDMDNDRRLRQEAAAQRRAAVMGALRRATRNEGSTTQPALSGTPTLAGQEGRSAPRPARGKGVLADRAL